MKILNNQIYYKQDREEMIGSVSRKKRLKILMVVQFFPCISETFILNQMTGLIDLGHWVDILAFGKAPDENKHHPGIDRYGLLKRVRYVSSLSKSRWTRLTRALVAIVKGLLLNPMALFRCLNFQKYKVFEIINLLIFCEPFFVRSYDVVHCQFGSVGKRVVFLKEIFRNVRFVVSFRGFDMADEVLQGTSDEPGCRELFGLADMVLPVCHYFAKRLVEFGCPEHKIQVLYGGIRLKDFVFRPDPRKIVSSSLIRIVTVGRLVDIKGYPYAIQAIAALVKDFPHIRYTIIGAGPLLKELQTLVEQFHMEENVQFSGSLREQDVRDCLEVSDIFLLASVKSASGDMEGIPNVLKEAMAIGIPVVSTVHAGIPELVQDGVNGFLAPERNVTALVEKIRFLLTHSELWPVIQKNGRQVVEERFDLDMSNQRLEKLYRQGLTA